MTTAVTRSAAPDETFESCLTRHQGSYFVEVCAAGVRFLFDPETALALKQHIFELAITAKVMNNRIGGAE